ncbi:hypothetical protein [Brachybacterium sp.]|uniref:hypothetical protein n=1 Tax=Brachybacterium sp. TaxID=1891286 RepID=UPI002ED1283C
MSIRPEGSGGCTEVLPEPPDTSTQSSARFALMAMPGHEMPVHAVEATDPDGDALTVTMDAQGVWVTCTSGDDEVTLGPFPATAMEEALRALVAVSRGE